MSPAVVRAARIRHGEKASEGRDTADGARPQRHRGPTRRAIRGGGPEEIRRQPAGFRTAHRLLGAGLGPLGERGPAGRPGLRRIRETERFRERLAEVVRAEDIPQWLDTPNDAFGGLKPLEVIERGETDRLWNMIFYLESGVAT